MKFKTRPEWSWTLGECDSQFLAMTDDEFLESLAAFRDVPSEIILLCENNRHWHSTLSVVYLEEVLRRFCAWIDGGRYLREQVDNSHNVKNQGDTCAPDSQ